MFCCLARSVQLIIALALLSLSASAQSRRSNPASATGAHIFASACASCHGLDGRGGERAPNIAQAPAVQRRSDEELTHIVTEGVPGTGMPAFHSLGSSGISAVVKYLRMLQGREQPSVLPGNAIRGRSLFFSDHAACSSCHMVAGQGGFIASDLSSYGKSHSVAEIREAILNPGRDSDTHARLAVVITKDGKHYDGLIRNEDNFSIQLQSMDGTYHFMDKADTTNVEYSSTTLMSSNYGATLSRGELNDIISYLLSAAKNSSSETSSENQE